MREPQTVEWTTGRFSTLFYARTQPVKMAETNNQSQVTPTIAGDDGEAVAGNEGNVAEIL